MISDSYWNITRVVEINVKGEKRWVEVRVDIRALAQAYGVRAWNSSGDRSQVGRGAVVVKTLATDVGNAIVPMGTRGAEK